MTKDQPRPSESSSFLRKILLLDEHTCPWWFGYTFDNPLRRLVHDPKAILGSYVQPGQTVADIGCGLGYFSIGLAQLVGPTGIVIALDVQEQMIRRARKRARRRAVADRIAFRVCAPDRLSLDEPIDFALAFWVAHEMPDRETALHEIGRALRSDGRFLIAEPIGHVSARHFRETTDLACRAGFVVEDGPPIRFSRSLLCSKGGGAP